jgi:hypothetical protein
LVKEAPVIRSRNLHPLPVAIGALVLSFMIAFVADGINARMVRQAQSTFHVLPAYFFRSAMPFIQVAVILGLAWLLLIRLPPNRVAAITFIIAGILVIGTYLTAFTGFFDVQRHSIIYQFRQTILILGTHSCVYYLSASSIFLGIASLLRRRAKTGTHPGDRQEKNVA